MDGRRKSKFKVLLPSEVKHRCSLVAHRAQRHGPHSTLGEFQIDFKKEPAIQEDIPATVKEMPGKIVWTDEDERQYREKKFATGRENGVRKTIARISQKLDLTAPREPRFVELDSQTKKARKKFLREKCRLQKKHVIEKPATDLVPVVQQERRRKPDFVRQKRREDYQPAAQEPRIRIPSFTAMNLLLEERERIEQAKLEREKERERRQTNLKNLEAQRQTILQRQKKKRGKAGETRPAEKMQPHPPPVIGAIPFSKSPRERREEKRKTIISLETRLNLESLNICIDELLGESSSSNSTQGALQLIQNQGESNEHHMKVRFAYDRVRDFKTLMARSIAKHKDGNNQVDPQREEAEEDDKNNDDETRSRNKVSSNNNNIGEIPAYLLKQMRMIANEDWVMNNIDIFEESRYENMVLMKK